MSIFFLWIVLFLHFSLLIKSVSKKLIESIQLDKTEILVV